MINLLEQYNTNPDLFWVFLLLVNACAGYYEQDYLKYGNLFSFNKYYSYKALIRKEIPSYHRLCVEKNYPIQLESQRIYRDSIATLRGAHQAIRQVRVL